MARLPRIVRDGAFRQAPIVALSAAVCLVAAAFALLPIEVRLPAAWAERLQAAQEQFAPNAPAETVPLDEYLATSPITPAPDAHESPLLRDLRAQEQTMRAARNFLPASQFRAAFEGDLKSVRAQIEAEEQRLQVLRSDGYTEEVVCGDRPC